MSKHIQRQYAALPYRVVDNVPQVLLVTSRETNRWVVPKGWPKKRLRPHQLAALEAEEEAGVTGEVALEPAGTFRYEKRLANGKAIPCLVIVYPLKVNRELPVWREQSQRERRWMTIDEASDNLADAGLVDILHSLGSTICRN